MVMNFNPPTRRFIRFLVAGGVNALFGFSVFSVFILFGIALWLALLAGMLSGVIFNFFTTGGYVFRDLSFIRFPRFALSYLFIYSVNFFLIKLISSYLNSDILSQAILVIPSALLSYFLMVSFVFIKK